MSKKKTGTTTADAAEVKVEVKEEKKTAISLREICMNRAKKMYGGKFPELIEERLDRELSKIEAGKTEPYYMAARELQAIARKNEIPLTFRNNFAGSLVSFFGDINYVNPLPAHYYCEECDYVEFPDVEPKIRECGFDLPYKTCPNCGRPLKKDGFLIPEEACFPYETDRISQLVVDTIGDYMHKCLPKEYEEITVEEAQMKGFHTPLDRAKFRELDHMLKLEHIILKNVGRREEEMVSKYFIRKDGEGTINLNITVSLNFTFLWKLEQATHIRAREAFFGDPKTFALFKGNTALGSHKSIMPFPYGTLGVPIYGYERGCRILSELKPHRYGQLLRIAGLVMGEGTWDDGIEHYVREENARLEDLITSRDDVIFYLEQFDVPRERILSVLYMTDSGRGLYHDSVRELERYGVPDRFMDAFLHIQYLFRRTTVVTHNGVAWQIAWFKTYYAREFYRCFFETYATPEMLAIVKSGANKVRQMVEENDPQVAKDLNRKPMLEFTILHVALEMYERGYTL